MTLTLLWWHWFVFGLLLMLGELATPGGFYIIFFGIGAMLVGLLSAMELAGPSWVQWLLFSRHLGRLAAPVQEPAAALDADQSAAAAG